MAMDNARANRCLHVLVSNMNPVNGRFKNGPMNAQNNIIAWRSATAAMYIVDPASRIRAESMVIPYFWKLFMLILGDRKKLAISREECVEPIGRSSVR